MTRKKTLKQKRDEIELSLRNQLQIKRATAPHFEDRIQSYLALWDIEQRLKKDIENRGITYTETMSTGREKTVENPSVKTIVALNKQQLMILKELGLTTDEAVEEIEEL